MEKLFIRLTKAFGIALVSIISLLSISVITDMTYLFNGNSIDSATVSSRLCTPLVLIGILIVCISITKIKGKRLSIVLNVIFSVGIIALSLVWGMNGYNDNNACMQAAIHLSGSDTIIGNYGGDYVAQYIGYFPNQSFYILILYGMIKIFGITSYYCEIYKIVCLVCYLIGSWILISELKKYNEYINELGLVLFLPAWLICLSMYNDMPSFMLCMIAYKIINKHDKFWWFGYLILGIAMCVRSSAIIFVIAIWLVNLDKNKIKMLLGLIISIAVYKICMSWSLDYICRIESNAVNCMQNYTINRWILIGLQDTEFAPGWVTFEASIDYDNKLIALVKDYISNPLKFIDFEIRKMASAFTMPDLETFEGFRKCLNNFSYCTWYKDFFFDRNWIYSIVHISLGMYNILMYVGVLLYIVLSNDKNMKSLFGIVVFIGFILFHLIWEIRARYIVLGVLCATPYAFRGYELAHYKINSIVKKENIWKTSLICIIILLLSILIQNIVVDNKYNIKKLDRIEILNNNFYEQSIGERDWISREREYLDSLESGNGL